MTQESLAYPLKNKAIEASHETCFVHLLKLNIVAHR